MNPKRTQGYLTHQNRISSKRIRWAVLALCLTGFAGSSESGQYSDRFKVGAGPAGMTFDGENIWVTHQTNGTGPTVTKLRAADGATLGRFPVSSFTQNAVFDGTYVWVTDWQYLSHTVTGCG
jgi:hypothetical protein